MISHQELGGTGSAKWVGLCACYTTSRTTVLMIILERYYLETLPWWTWQITYLTVDMQHIR